MERVAYDRMAESESEHWWFVGRRAVLDRLIDDHAQLPSAARILEAGCGTGGNLAMLADHGRVDAFEPDEAARAQAAATAVARVHDDRLPDLTRVPDGAFDLIAMLDVLEHLDDDEQALRALAEKLSPSGRVLITVPAMPWLWSHHDVLHHHRRRYTRRTLSAVIDSAGLDIERIGYFNSILFPVAVAQRLVHKVTGSDQELDGMPAPILNRTLRAIFAGERHLLGRLPMPFGLSIYAVVAR